MFRSTSLFKGGLDVSSRLLNQSKCKLLLQQLEGQQSHVGYIMRHLNKSTSTTSLLKLVIANTNNNSHIYYDSNLIDCKHYSTKKSKGLLITYFGLILISFLNEIYAIKSIRISARQGKQNCQA
jgi:hypothetical protein